MGREFPSQPVLGVGAVVLQHTPGSACLEVLLVKRANPPSQGEWSLPGGAVELGERLDQAVAREVLEETGLTVQPMARVAVLDHIVPVDPTGASKPSIRFHYVLIDFVCRVTGGRLVPATDALDGCWAPLDDLQPFSLRTETLDVIRTSAEHFLATGLESD